MIETLAFQDTELNDINITEQDIINSLTLDDVKHFLESLGVTQLQVNEEKQIIICPTICHNPISKAESMKLYWYQNYKIFRCYTQCNESMSIFKLYQKFMEINYHEVSRAEAREYIKGILSHVILKQKENVHDTWSIEEYKFDKTLPTLPIYSKEIMTYFIKYYHPTWLKDGITKSAMDKFNIRFSISQNKIIIPHYNINGELIGIRGRTIDPEEAKVYGKYRPIQIGNKIYNHHLGFNLYGIYENKNGLKKRRSAIIAEGEKSVLLDYGNYGEYANTVACCGSSFNKYQISLLTDILGVNEITIAFDKEYKIWNDEKAKKYRAKITKMCEEYSNQANFFYIWDYENLLNEKDSPFDKGKEVFEYLYKNRVRVR